MSPVAVARDANAGPSRVACGALGARDKRGGRSSASVRRTETVPVAVSAAPRIRDLKRRAHVVHLDPEQRIRARAPVQVEALEEERVAAARTGEARGPERVAEAHAHAERPPELVVEGRDLERAGRPTAPAAADADG